MTAEPVDMDQLYQSAVKGRSDFREAYREQLELARQAQAERATLLTMLELLVLCREADPERLDQAYGHLANPDAQFEADHEAAWEGAKEMVRLGKEGKDLTSDT